MGWNSRLELKAGTQGWNSRRELKAGTQGGSSRRGLKTESGFGAHGEHGICSSRYGAKWVAWLATTIQVTSIPLANAPTYTVPVRWKKKVLTMATMVMMGSN